MEVVARRRKRLTFGRFGTADLTLCKTASHSRRPRIGYLTATSSALTKTYVFLSRTIRFHWNSGSFFHLLGNPSGFRQIPNCILAATMLHVTASDGEQPMVT